MAFFTSRADINVGIVNEYVLNSGGAIQGQGQQIINFFNPTGGLPATVDGARYISTATANGWINNAIVIYSSKTRTWKNITPIAGTLVWLTAVAAPSVRMWNSTTAIWENPLVTMGGMVAVPSTDDAIVRFTGTSGQVQNSGVIIDDLNNISNARNVNILGNVFVGGTITATSTDNLIVSDRFITLNNGYTTPVGQSTGLVMNYLPTAITTTSVAPGFTPAVAATSDATIQTDDAGPLWVVGDIVMVSASVSNDGLYEVQSHAANVLTLKSTGLTPPTLDFVQDQLISEGTVGADITGMNITTFRTNIDGVLQYATGSTSAIVYRPVGSVVTEKYIIPGTTVQSVPPGATTIRVSMWGGGGNGGSATTAGGGGGGAAQAIIGFERPIVPGVDTMTVTVGDTEGNSTVEYTGTNAFTLTAYAGARGGEANPAPAGGGGGGGTSSPGRQGTPDDNGFGGNASFAYPIQGLFGGSGGDDSVTAGIAQPGIQGQQQQFSIPGSGGGGGGVGSGAAGGGGLGGPGGAAPGRAGGGAGGPGGPGGDGAPNTAGTPGSSAIAGSGAGGGGASDTAIGGLGGSGVVLLEYF